MRRILSLLVMLGLILATAPAARSDSASARPLDGSYVTAVTFVPQSACPKAVNRLLVKAFTSAYKWNSGKAAARSQISPTLLKAQALSGGLVASQIGAIVSYLKGGGTDSARVMTDIANAGEAARQGNC